MCGHYALHCSLHIATLRSELQMLHQSPGVDPAFLEGGAEQCARVRVGACVQNLALNLSPTPLYHTSTLQTAHYSQKHFSCICLACNCLHMQGGANLASQEGKKQILLCGSMFGLQNMATSSALKWNKSWMRPHPTIRYMTAYFFQDWLMMLTITKIYTPMLTHYLNLATCSLFQ